MSYDDRPPLGRVWLGECVECGRRVTSGTECPECSAEDGILVHDACCVLCPDPRDD